MERRTGMKRGHPRKENAMKEADMAYSEELVFRPLPQLVIEANVNPQEFATPPITSSDQPAPYSAEATTARPARVRQIGRASCRERV